MIGGNDLTLPTGIAPSEALDLAVHIILRIWRGAILQDAMTGQCYRSYPEMPFGTTSEIMIYKDQTALDAWEQLGADASNANTMIHLLAYNSDEMTAVVDNAEHPEIQQLIRALDRAIKDRWRMGELKEAA